MLKYTFYSKVSFPSKISELIRRRAIVLASIVERDVPEDERRVERVARHVHVVFVAERLKNLFAVVDPRPGDILLVLCAHEQAA